MDKNISIDCLKHLVEGLNCHYKKDYVVKETKEGKLVIVENGLDLGTGMQLVLSQKPGQIKFTIENFDESKKDTLIEIFKKFSPKMVGKVLEIALSDNILCSGMGSFVEIICNFFNQ